MTAVLRVLVPDGTTNYIENPSLRFDTTGWVAVGSTITRVLDQAMFGISSLKVVTSGAALREGVYYRVNALAGISEPITISAYVKGSGRVHLRLINSGGKEWVSSGISLSSDRWTRLEVLGYSTGTNDLRLYVETDGTAPKVATFYVDGAQMERKAYATTYCDGYQVGCRWNGADSSSSSTRDENTRAGGRWISLTGPDRFDPNIYATLVSGMGMAPIENSLQPWAFNPGSYFNFHRATSRYITIRFHLINPTMNVFRGEPDLSSMHNLRQTLLSMFNPDLTTGDENVRISYQEGIYPLFLNVRYDSGLEGDWDVRNPFADALTIRLLAVDPAWQEENKVVTSMNYDTTSSRLNRAAKRINGEWSDMNGGFNNTVLKMAVGKRGEIYAVGTFTVANDDLTAINPLIPARYISYWDGTKWNQMGAGADNSISDIIVVPNGDLYVTGYFTNIGGVAANRIAKYDYALGTWSALGTGLDNQGRALAYDANRNRLYVGGQFHTAGGITAWHIAYWDGSWHQMGARRGLDDKVNALKLDKYNATLFVGGEFDQEYGVAGTALSGACQYSPSTNTFSAMGSGFDYAAVYDMAYSASSGILYAVGGFTASNSIPMYSIAYWNGAGWFPLGTGTDTAGYIQTIFLINDSQIYVRGVWSTIGGRPYVNQALWNGVDFVPFDLYLTHGHHAGIGYFIPMAVVGFQMYGAHEDHETTALAGITTVNNIGTTEVSPIFYIVGPGRLEWIENQTKARRIYIDFTILDDEEIYIDCGAGRVISTTRGDFTWKILRGSNIQDFTLLPGENRISMLMIDSVASSITMSYVPTHWSVDATRKPIGLP